MAGNDYRTNPSERDSCTFYVFDDLANTRQNGRPSNVLRYDTVQEAIAVYQHIREEHPARVISLGGSINEHEIDFIQCRGGENVLCGDYQRSDAFRDRPDVSQAIETALIRLGVNWQLDYELTNTTVLIPQEFDRPPLGNGLSNKVLYPANPDKVLTCVDEVFCQQSGWLSMNELPKASREAQAVGQPPIKVTGFNVAYRVRDDDRGGYIDINPSDYRYMKESYQEVIQARNQAPEIKTMDGWHAFAESSHIRSFDSYVKAGDRVSEEMVDYFIDLLPPSTLHETLIQVGSPYESKLGEDNRMHPTFATFAKEAGQWQYRGHCFQGKAHEQDGIHVTIEEMRKRAQERMKERGIDAPDTPPSRPQDLEL